MFSQKVSGSVADTLGVAVRERHQDPLARPVVVNQGGVGEMLADQGGGASWEP